jgi:hypothetical protein
MHQHASRNAAKTTRNSLTDLQTRLQSSDLERGEHTRPQRSTFLRLVEALELGPPQRTALASARPQRRPSEKRTQASEAKPVPLAVSALPAPLTSFVGRGREIHDIVNRLIEGDSGRLLTLIGPGGIGKTRLAIEAARRAVAVYADGGVALVELGALTCPDLVAERVAESLGLREQTGQSTLETLLEVLRSRHLLMVLDNSSITASVHGPICSGAPQRSQRLQHTVEIRQMCGSNDSSHKEPP